MGRKRNPYIQLFTRDILSSPRCRALSESAAGVYLFLLCRLNEPPTPGAYRLSDWELHPTWKRSCTQQCLATADKKARLQYFAKMLSKNDLPWKQATILSGLQELYKYGIITVDADMLIQPRMLKDNGINLPDIDNDGDKIDTILDDPASGSMAIRGNGDFAQNNYEKCSAEKSTKLGTQKVQRKVHDSRAGARTHLRVENMSNNKDSKGLQGKGDCSKTLCKNSKTDKNTPKRAETAQISTKDSATGNLSIKEKKSQQRSNKGQKRSTVADNPPTVEEVQAYFNERAAQGKPFQYITVEGFYDACCQSGWTLKDGKPMIDWQARCRTFENYRKEHNDRHIAHRSDDTPKSVGEDNFAGQETW